MGDCWIGSYGGEAVIVSVSLAHQPFRHGRLSSLFEPSEELDGLHLTAAAYLIRANVLLFRQVKGEEASQPSQSEALNGPKMHIHLVG